MTRVRQAILPLYLLLCLLIGGSSQAIWGNAILQLGAVAILAWTAVTASPQPLSGSGRWLLVLAAATVLLVFAQLVPLPPAIWTSFPGRQLFADGFRLMGMSLPWLPVSEAPYDTLTTAATLLPPLALLIGLLRLRSWSSGSILGAVVLGAIASVVLGVLQVTGGDGSWYFYRITNFGVAVGAFANGNHFATLLLAAIPSLAAIAAMAMRTGNKQQRMLAGAPAAAAGAALAIGALMNSSAAFLLLGPPVIAASVLLAARFPERRVKQGIIAIAVLLTVAAGSVALLGDRLPGWGTNASIETRTTFWKTTGSAIGTEGIAGSGFGTFQKVYGRYEDAKAVDRFYVNHAHNDYLELALEGGLPAVILLLCFFAWWFARAYEVWFRPPGLVGPRAAAVVSAAVLLHSLFDYPLRTAAIMAVMAVALAILGGAKGEVRKTRTGEHKARHATL